MNFQKYQHIEKLGRSEVDGILVGDVYVFPKLDGSNGVVWYSDGVIRTASRNREITANTEDNHGFREYIMDCWEYFEGYFNEFPDNILYGEWLVPHTLKTYRDDMWRRFWIFDVYVDNIPLMYEEYHRGLNAYSLDYVPPIGMITNPSEDKLWEWAEHRNRFGIKNNSGVGEGIVLKNYQFVNRYGRTTWAKIVLNSFKDEMSQNNVANVEMQPVEYQIAQKYLTQDIVDKVYANIAADHEIGFQNSDIPRLISTVWHDFVTEELWTAIKKHKNPTINFRVLQHHVTARLKQLKPEVF